MIRVSLKITIQSKFMISRKGITMINKCLNLQIPLANTRVRGLKFRGHTLHQLTASAAQHRTETFLTGAKKQEMQGICMS